MSAGGLFAKLDLDLRDHPRALAAGSAMATWCWALAYIRAHSLNGFLPREAIAASWVGEKQALKDIKVLVSEKVGLFAEVEGGAGWQMLKYEQHNDTKTTIDGRREAARLRMQKVRDKAKAANDGANVRANDLRTFGEHDANGSPGVPVSDSLSDLGSGSLPSSQLSPDHPDSPPCPAEPDPLTSPPAWRAEQLDAVDLAMGRLPKDPAQCWAMFVTQSQRDARAITPEAWKAWVVRQIGFDTAERRGPKGRIVQRDPPGGRAFEVDDGNHDYAALAAEADARRAAAKGTGT